MTTFTKEDREAVERAMTTDELLNELEDCGQFFEDRLYKKAASTIRKQRLALELVDSVVQLIELGGMAFPQNDIVKNLRSCLAKVDE